MGRRCKSAMTFNKDEKWYLSEATRLLKEATKLIHAKEKSAAGRSTSKKPVSSRRELYDGGMSSF